MKWGESTEVCTPMEPLTEVIISYEYHCILIIKQKIEW